MKFLLALSFIFSVSLSKAQTVEPIFEKSGDEVKVTYYYKDGSVKQQGFFKDKKLTGTWTSFDQKGNKTAIAHYENGQKVGKWFLWQGDVLREINYNKNVVASVQTWREDNRLAVKQP